MFNWKASVYVFEAVWPRHDEHNLCMDSLTIYFVIISSLASYKGPQSQRRVGNWGTILFITTIKSKDSIPTPVTGSTLISSTLISFKTDQAHDALITSPVCLRRRKGGAFQQFSERPQTENFQRQSSTAVLQKYPSSSPRAWRVVVGEQVANEKVFSDSFKQLAG